jgi:hypothetical protein
MKRAAFHGVKHTYTIFSLFVIYLTAPPIRNLHLFFLAEKASEASKSISQFLSFEDFTYAHAKEGGFLSANVPHFKNTEVWSYPCTFLVFYSFEFGERVLLWEGLHIHLQPYVL